MKPYMIIESCSYIVLAESEDDAITKFLNMDTVTRDAHFDECHDRDVYALYEMDKEEQPDNDLRTPLPR